MPDIDPISRYETDLARVSLDIFKQIASADQSSGVKLIDGFEYLEYPSEAYVKLQGRYSDIDCFRVLEDSELPADVKFGTMYRTWSLNTPVYLAWLERQLLLGGVRFIRHNLVSIVEGFYFSNIESRILINCSGTGFSDPKVYPTRGITFSTFIGSNSCRPDCSGS